MKKSQLNAIYYAQKRKKEQAQECAARRISGFATAYKYSDYKGLTWALKDIEKTFERAEKNINKALEDIEKEIRRATAKGCKKIYIDQLKEKKINLEKAFNEVKRG